MTAERLITKQAEIALGDGERAATFIASSNSIDRYGDIVEQDWNLENFWRNPAFLWSHNAWDPPIGWVRSFEPNDARTHTVARVEFLPEGVDDFADKLCRMVQCKALRAVSIGFRPMERERRHDAEGKPLDGLRFLRSELIELSLCTIGANQDAVALAHSLDASPSFIRRLFPDFTAPSAPEHRSTHPLRDEAFETLRRIKRA